LPALEQERELLVLATFQVLVKESKNFRAIINELVDALNCENILPFVVSDDRLPGSWPPLRSVSAQVFGEQSVSNPLNGEFG